MFIYYEYTVNSACYTTKTPRNAGLVWSRTTYVNEPTAAARRAVMSLIVACFQYYGVPVMVIKG